MRISNNNCIMVLLSSNNNLTVTHRGKCYGWKMQARNKLIRSIGGAFLSGLHCPVFPFFRSSINSIHRFSDRPGPQLATQVQQRRGSRGSRQIASQCEKRSEIPWDTIWKNFCDHNVRTEAIVGWKGYSILTNGIFDLFSPTLTISISLGFRCFSGTQHEKRSISESAKTGLKQAIGPWEMTTMD